MNSDSREFHLGDVLSITTGLLLSPSGMGGLYEILNFMTRDNLFTHQLPRAAEACAPSLRDQLPALADLEARTRAASREGNWSELAPDWAATLCSELGVENFSVRPLGCWLSVDPLKELGAMVVDDKIILVEAP